MTRERTGGEEGGDGEETESEREREEEGAEFLRLGGELTGDFDLLLERGTTEAEEVLSRGERSLDDPEAEEESSEDEGEGEEGEEYPSSLRKPSLS